MNKWHLHFLRVARECALMSKDPSSQIGAVVVKDRRIISTGYNGFPPRMNDDPELLNNREEKYRRVIHAEVNALLRAGLEAQGATLYLWGFRGAPCGECTKFLLACGITSYVAAGVRPPPRWEDNLTESRRLLAQAGVQYQTFPSEEVSAQRLTAQER